MKVGIFKMRILLIFCMLQFQLNLILSQNSNCFKTEKIPPVRYKPSKPLLFSSMDEKGIVFKIDESKESQILRKRIISILNVENNG